jgi:hypothetical protein
MAGENTIAVQVDSVDALPEAMRGLFTQDPTTGKYSAELAKPEVVKDFRTNNIRLAQENEAAGKAKTAAEQAAQATAAEVEKLRNELAAAKLGKPNEELEAEIKRRMEKAEGDHKVQLENLGKKATAAEELAKSKDDLLANELVNAGIATAAALIPNFTKAPLAIAEQQELARKVWRFEDGKMVPRGSDGKIIYGTDGVTPITYQQWMEGKTHLIGAGVNGGGSRGGGYLNASGAVVLPRDKAGDVAAYRAAKADAEKRGVPFSIEPPQ